MSKIVIVGGGFGGVRAALDLERKLGDKAEITLIDRNGYHLFAPALYEVASAFGITKDRFSVNLRKTVSIPFEDIFKGKRVQLVHAEVAHVSLDEKFITTKNDAVYPFDYLVLALGSQTNDYNIPGIREYAFQFKTIEDALMLNHQLTMLFERASRGSQELPIRIVIGGGGFTGVELAAELACTVKNLAKQYRIASGHSIITLVEAGLKILPQIEDKERAKIIQRLTHLGVAIKTEAVIEEINPDRVRLKNGHTIKHHILTWTAGVKANEFLKTIQGLQLTQAGKVVVDEHLNTPRHEYVFALGDMIEFIDHKTQKPEPALGYVAIQHGQVAAHNIVRAIKNKELKNHKPFYSLWIVPVGGKYAVAHLWGGIMVSGFLGWVIRALADLRYFVQILSLKKAIRLLQEEVEVFVKND